MNMVIIKIIVNWSIDPTPDHQLLVVNRQYTDILILI